VVLAKQRFNLRERDLQSLHATFVPFTAQTRMSGINIDQRMIRKGSVDAIRRHVEANGGHFPPMSINRWKRWPVRAPRRWWSPKANACWGLFR
jgi:K+-transporting ATPase ATPase B chain